jgi:hypothetical protein
MVSMFDRLKEVPSLRVSRLDLWWSEEFAPDNPFNAGARQAHALLSGASCRVPEAVVVHDTYNYGFSDCEDLYRKELMLAAVAWDYRLGNIFGSRRYPGFNAGKRVPAVVVRFIGDVAPLAAPHEQWQRRQGEGTSHLPPYHPRRVEDAEPG